MHESPVIADRVLADIDGFAAEALALLPALMSLDAKVPEADGGWLRFPEQKPEIGREYFIWLKPVNGDGSPEWSIRKAVFDVTKWTDKGTGYHYEADVQSRITHFRPLFPAPLGSEIENEPTP